ncbi:hypothetical protein B0I26_103108 [Anoxybacillus vitaminiphilus]|uniref:Uncharacterized protein n=1 Tax=Paranoxybacillus vitaminiphilus TaxID=581036 RepID=A0A327YLU2_9BACL|nr:hypothetical protein [Anoxybacillus vitaminiphilus]RAK21156.1 hypothetical protein B0I26_103108 [Anoxybacillus vitaminiphilus]
MKVFYNGKIENGIMTVELTHYSPDMLDDETKNNGIILEFVNEEPTPEFIEGKLPIKKINVITKELFYDYVDYIKPKTETEIMQEKITELEILTGNLMLEIATLKAGGVS